MLSKISVFGQRMHRGLIDSPRGSHRRGELPLPLSLQLRIQHETFPHDTEQSSRLVLLVRDMEVRDRLAQSQINKFLYQYTTDAMPRQSHANMVGPWINPQAYPQGAHEGHVTHS